MIKKIAEVKKRILILPLVVALFTTTSLADDLPELQTAPYVDIPRYMGTWYEIASFPQSFQKDCAGTMAIYTLLDSGKVDVLNRCHKKDLGGPIKDAHGIAKVVDSETNAKLKVRFFFFFTGDYWILEVGGNYEYAVVGHPTRKYLWILSRTPTMDETLYQQIQDRLRTQNYDLTKLQKTLQTEPSPL